MDPDTSVTESEVDAYVEMLADNDIEDVDLEDILDHYLEKLADALKVSSIEDQVRFILESGGKEDLDALL